MLARSLIKSIVLATKLAMLSYIVHQGFKSTMNLKYYHYFYNNLLHARLMHNIDVI